ncbi:hypothetical protein HPB48_017122 [Haemaphysalis longicornis]|uniref:Uncharacterized protein n=1 Tax=Haemaphysalis longicornis TaxID=44386 RepID=A0A9J6GJ02_HAELO|nr:hypothetical protein HPB48_017122 [Haemaphysalis longicornis]
MRQTKTTRKGKMAGRDAGVWWHNTLKGQAHATTAGPPGSRSSWAAEIREAANTIRAAIEAAGASKMAVSQQRSRSEGSTSRFQGLKASRRVRSSERSPRGSGNAPHTAL